jgi:hypothetical protein
MFGFQKFIRTDSCKIVWLAMFMSSGAHFAIFSEYVKGNLLMMCVASLFLLLLALLVVYISSRVVVVYWDGELENVSKDIFITALENDSIQLIDDDSDKLNAFMRKYFFLSSKEIKLLNRKIAWINLESSKFKIDLEDI